MKYKQIIVGRRGRCVGAALATAVLLSACGGGVGADASGSGEGPPDGDGAAPGTGATQADGQDEDSGGDVTTITWSQVSPDDDPYMQVGQYLEERLQEYTDGAFEIEFFTGGSLGDEITTLDLYGSGDVDMGAHTSASVATVIPEIGFLATPFLFASIEHWREVMDNPEAYEYWQNVLEENDASFRIGTYGTYGSRSVYTRDRVIESVEDFDGLRLRIIESPVQQRVWSALGADPVVLPYNDIYSGLEAGVIDAAESTAVGLSQVGHHEVAEQYIRTNNEIAMTFIFVSEDFYQGLSEKHREAFDLALEDTRAEMTNIMLEREEQAFETVVSDAMTVHEFPEEARQQVLEIVNPIHDEIAADVGTEDFLATIRDAAR